MLQYYSKILKLKYHCGGGCLVTMSCPTLCDHIDPPGSSVHGIS